MKIFLSSFLVITSIYFRVLHWSCAWWHTHTPTRSSIWKRTLLFTRSMHNNRKGGHKGDTFPFAIDDVSFKNVCNRHAPSSKFPSEPSSKSTQFFFLSFSLNVCYKYTKSITKTVALDNFAYNNNSSNILKHYGSTREPSCRVDDIKGRWWWQKIIRVCKDVWDHNEAGNSLMFVVQLRSQQIIFFYKINILC